MSAAHCGLNCLLRMLTCPSSAGSQILVLLLVSVMVSYASAQQSNQRPRSGNHTIGHPCTGNFAWVRYDSVVLESYDLDRMRAEVLQANDKIEELLGVRPVSFAYPCGQTYVGRGTNTKSYVPLIAELFQTGRRWLDETTNAPAHFDPAQVMAMRMDGEDFSTIRRLIERTKRNETWLVLAGHGVGDSTRWGTNLGMLRELLAEFALAHGIGAAGSARAGHRPTRQGDGPSRAADSGTGQRYDFNRVSVVNSEIVL